MKPVLVGVDPGSTSAVAVLDFDGKFAHIKSSKNFPPRKIISEVIEHGKPVIVTSDKAKTPSKVDKIANSLGAEKFEPEEDLSQERKRELGEGENSHEKDASAAAKYAYKQLKPKIRKIEELEEEREEEKSEIASRYFSGQLTGTNKENSGSVEGSDESKRERQNQEVSEGSEDESEAVDGEKWMQKSRKLENKVENLEEHVEDLQEKLEFREQQRRNLQSKYDKLKAGKRDEVLKERELSRKNAELKEKNQKIEQLEQQLEKTRIREKQYEKAVDILDSGGEILPLIDKETGKIPEKAATRSGDLRDRLISQGEKIYHVDELDGVELLDRIVVDELPEENPGDIIEKYRDAR